MPACKRRAHGTFPTHHTLAYADSTHLADTIYTVHMQSGHTCSRSRRRTRSHKQARGSVGRECGANQVKTAKRAESPLTVAMSIAAEAGVVAPSVTTVSPRHTCSPRHTVAPVGARRALRAV